MLSCLLLLLWLAADSLLLLQLFLPFLFLLLFLSTWLLLLLSLLLSLEIVCNALVIDVGDAAAVATVGLECCR